MYFSSSFTRVTALFCVLLSSCGEKEEEKTTSDASCSAKTSLSLVNGFNTTDHPEIGVTTGDFSIFCSGTFVSSTTMITAAHCVPDTADHAIFYVPGATPTWNDSNVPKVRATKVVHLGYSANDYVNVDPDVVDVADLNISDLAVLIFPPNTAPASVRVADARPSEGERVMLLGYGGQVLGNVDPTTYPPIRAVGYNKIVPRQNHPTFFPPEQLFTGEITAQHSVDANGELALIQKGDSGGALIHNGKLAGVTTRTISSSGYYWNAFTSTMGDKAQALFAAARLEGADIPVGDAPVVTPPVQPGGSQPPVVVAPNSGNGSGGSNTPINPGSTLPSDCAE